MASFDRKFEIIAPDLAMITRMPLEVADRRLVDPTNTDVVPLIDGEFVQLNTTNQFRRADNLTHLSYALLEERGDYGVQASRKLAVAFIGGYIADTIVFDSGLTTLGAPVMHGNLTIGGSTRRGLVAHTSTNLVIGYVLRTASSNGGRLRFQQTLV
jgi:hypothetical protein